jgi:Coenzyme PQQ synthesis protein D (PqqD)
MACVTVCSRSQASEEAGAVSDTIRLRKAAIEWRLVEGEVVALDRVASEYVSVNRSGGFLWPLLVAGTTRGELVDRLVESYGLERPDAERDVDAFIAVLGERQLLEP